ncbi:hypothetical protein GCM10009864_25690 [Streptomyces lunalinharesii]|uniref:Uncharacterized protein n=1 Tax=Streptomyces lunalinharesii TaxID=333384 RepID=A0ABN3RQ13_9ACTN
MKKWHEAINLRPWASRRARCNKIRIPTLEEYEATFEPFTPDVLPDAPKGPAGALHMAVTSANALHHPAHHPTRRRHPMIDATSG